MADTRAPRKSATRETETRRKPWAPPSHLAAPPAPEGFVHRWIRVAMRGEEDKMNVNSKLREGWEPVLATDHPEIFLSGIENERFKDNIVIGGLLLCKAPQEMVDERNQYYQEQAKGQMTSVDNSLMRENDPRMPLFNDRKSTVTFGKG